MRTMPTDGQVPTDSQVLIRDTAQALFRKDLDVIELMEQFSAKNDSVSDSCLIDRLIFLRKISWQRAEALVLGPTLVEPPGEARIA